MAPEVQGSLTPPVRILIADDHPLIRKIAKSTLNDEPHFQVIGEAQNGLEAVQKTEELKPDVVVLNITMPVLDGFEAARRIRQRLPKTAVVILSSDMDQRFINEAKRVGARA
jgi:DNA-binding NarL/FixJ family response regulator